MREILFRAKSKVRGDWVEGCLVRRYNGYVGIDRPHPDLCFELIQVEPKTVGQYTGLKDKNGMRIFENDIVQVKIEQTGVYFIGEITWYRGSLCIMFSSSHKVCDLYTVQTSNIEVIGNRFDNPELLEG